MSIYELKQIAHRFDDRPVLDIDHWQVDSDAVTGIVGPNGAGKSTLLALLGFVISPTRGEIRFHGAAVRPFSDSIRGKVALLPQETFLLKRSVYRNIVYGLKIRPLKEDRPQRVNTAMEMVGLDPNDFAQRPWFALSGGEARRVALAARLALRPQVLLMDEPTASVDEASAQMIKAAALHARQQWGTTLIVSSHDGQWLADISDHTVHLFRGRILGSGHHSLIFGPWQQNSALQAVSFLSPEQAFMADGRPDNLKTAVAALPADRLRIYPYSYQMPGRFRRLKGALLRLSFERSSGRISASVLVGSTIMTAYLSGTAQSEVTFGPGQTVWLGYDPSQVEWY